MAQLTAPISFASVNAALGTNITDQALLCKSTQINPWAKFKPVRWLEVNTLTALKTNVKEWNPNAQTSLQWWKSNDGNYGLSASQASDDFESVVTEHDNIYNSLKALWAKVNGSMCGWSYTKPNGGASSPYRLQDFLQYNHQAARPIKSLKTYNVTSSISGKYTVTVDYVESADVDITQRDYIRPDDIAGGSLKRGIAIFRYINNAYEPIAWCTGVNWEGDGVGTESFSKPMIDNFATTVLATGKNYYVLPFYSTVSLPQPEPGKSLFPSSAGTLYTMPYTIKTLTFQITASSRTILLSNKTIAMDYSYTGTLQINVVGSAMNTVSWYAAVVNENWTPLNPSGTYFDMHSGTTSQPVGTTTLCTFSVPAGSLVQGHSWRVHLNIDGTEYDITLRSPATPA